MKHRAIILNIFEGNYYFVKRHEIILNIFGTNGLIECILFIYYTMTSKGNDIMA